MNINNLQIFSLEIANTPNIKPIPLNIKVIRKYIEIINRRVKIEIGE